MYTPEHPEQRRERYARIIAPDVWGTFDDWCQAKQFSEDEIRNRIATSVRLRDSLTRADAIIAVDRSVKVDASEQIDRDYGYQNILQKLKEATGPFDHEKAYSMSISVYEANTPKQRLLRIALGDGLASTGAALTLVVKELPRWRVISATEQRIFGSHHWAWAVTLGVPSPFGGHSPTASSIGPTLPLAILIALCKVPRIA